MRLPFDYFLQQETAYRIQKVRAQWDQKDPRKDMLVPCECG